MTRYVISEGAFRYTVAMESDTPIAARLNALVQARLVDELTGQAITTGITVTPYGTAFEKPITRLNVSSRVATGGLAGLVGIPVTVLPRLDSQAYNVGIRVRAEGYVPVQVTQSLGPQATFPVEFAPAIIGDLLLHRTPVVLRGSTMRRTATGVVPVPNATVGITGIWRTLPTANAVVPASAPNLVAIHPPLYANRSTAGTTIRTITVTPAAGEDKTLLVPAIAGSTTARLSNRENIAVGDVLVVGDGGVDEREYVTIAAIDGAVSASQPATITFAHPLALFHPPHTVVRKGTVSAPGANHALGVDASTGDQTLLTASVAGLGSAGVVQISGGGGDPEYHWMRPYTAVSDAEGQYRLPPLSRVAQCTVQATHAPDAPVTQTVGPLYPAREQYLDLMFV